MAHAQVGVISSQAWSQFGQPVPFAQVRVCSATSVGTPCTPTVPIYLDYGLTIPASNPYTADQYGNYTLYVPAITAPNLYTVQLIPASGVTWSYVFPGPSAGGQIEIGTQYHIPAYLVGGIGVGPSNVVVDSTGNSLTVPNLMQSFNIVSQRPKSDVTDTGFAGGADSTGTTDSTAAINAANAYAQSVTVSGTPTCVYFPPGQYLVSSELVINYWACWLGDFNGGSQIVVTTPGQNGVKVTGLGFNSIGNFPANGNGMIANLTITTANTSGAPAHTFTGDLLSFINTNQWQLFNVHVTNTGGRCINMAGDDVERIWAYNLTTDYCRWSYTSSYQTDEFYVYGWNNGNPGATLDYGNVQYDFCNSCTAGAYPATNSQANSGNSWVANTPYVAGYQVYDGAYNQTVKIPGTSGASIVWNDATDLGTTTDGTITWVRTGLRTMLPPNHHASIILNGANLQIYGLNCKSLFLMSCVQGDGEGISVDGGYAEGFLHSLNSSFMTGTTINEQYRTSTTITGTQIAIPVVQDSWAVNYLNDPTDAQTSGGNVYTVYFFPCDYAYGNTTQSSCAPSGVLRNQYEIAQARYFDGTPELNLVSGNRCLSGSTACTPSGTGVAWPANTVIMFPPEGGGGLVVRDMHLEANNVTSAPAGYYPLAGDNLTFVSTDTGSISSAMSKETITGPLPDGYFLQPPGVAGNLVQAPGAMLTLSGNVERGWSPPNSQVFGNGWNGLGLRGGVVGLDSYVGQTNLTPPTGTSSTALSQIILNSYAGFSCMQNGTSFGAGNIAVRGFGISLGCGSSLTGTDYVDQATIPNLTEQYNYGTWAIRDMSSSSTGPTSRITFNGSPSNASPNFQFQLCPLGTTASCTPTTSSNLNGYNSATALGVSIGMGQQFVQSSKTISIAAGWTNQYGSGFTFTQGISNPCGSVLPCAAGTDAVELTTASDTQVDGIRDPQPSGWANVGPPFSNGIWAKSLDAGSEILYYGLTYSGNVLMPCSTTALTSTWTFYPCTITTFPTLGGSYNIQLNNTGSPQSVAVWHPQANNGSLGPYVATSGTAQLTAVSTVASQFGQFNELFDASGALPTAGQIPTGQSNGTFLWVAPNSSTGTTGSIGGGALLVNNCATGTATVTGVTSAQVITVTPVTDPNGATAQNYDWYGYMSAANTVTVKVCALVAGTPGASAYNVRAQ